MNSAQVQVYKTNDYGKYLEIFLSTSKGLSKVFGLNPKVLFFIFLFL